MTNPVPEILDRAAVAALLGIPDPATITRYLRASRPDGRYASHPFPAPDGFLAGRAPWWRATRADELKAWAAARPGRGVGGGRPRAKDSGSR